MNKDIFIQKNFNGSITLSALNPDYFKITYFYWPLNQALRLFKRELRRLKRETKV